MGWYVSTIGRGIERRLHPPRQLPLQVRSESLWVKIETIGGAEGDRTPDLMTASHALSQLSYGPIAEFEWS